MSEEWKKYIQKAREEYLKIRAVSCRAFDNELVYFNEYGFEHLLKKWNKPRDPGDQARRLYLVKMAPDIISKSRQYVRYTKDTSAEFWEFEKDFGKRTIIVVVRKLNDGRKHYFGIRDKKRKKIP